VGQTDRWALPDEPGPDVTQVYDRCGQRWERDGNYWRCHRTHLIWRNLLVNEGPLTRQPPQVSP
jgi:hypothetical protein